jgi:glyoxylase-like metal-dependent hydrolase (beta-lactamase superfamily II)
MSLEIKVLDIGDIELESSFLVHARAMGTLYRVPTFAHLIIGGEAPVLVDTGYINTDIMQRLGMRGIQTREQQLEHQLARYGLKYGDVKYIVHTHLHIDHAGLDHAFPTNTCVIVNRRELEYSVSGLMGGQYPPEYIKPLIDRLHTPGALRLLDVELSGGEEIIPGVVGVSAGGHTEGSMNILIDTAQGRACICGDVVYDIHDQLIVPHLEVNVMEPAMTGNHGTSSRQEKSAIKKALNGSTYLLPMHDRPAMVRQGAVIGRLHELVPGPVTQVSQKRNWFPV